MLEGWEEHCEDILDVEIEGETADGAVVTSNIGAQVVATEKMGYWGFAETWATPPVIHLWVSPGAAPEDVVELIGHELGHITGTPAADDIEEELRAHEYGQVARSAFEALKLIEEKRKEPVLA
jgi:hypothetical protein